MASLRVIPYKYVPTKRRRNDQPRLIVEKQSSAQCNEQQSEPSIFPKTALPSSIAENPGDFRGAIEKSKYYNVYETTVDELARRGSLDPAPIPNVEIFSSGRAKKDALGKEMGSSQVEFIENGTSGIDLCSDIDSLFGNINELFEDQEIGPANGYSGCYAANHHKDASVDLSEALSWEDGFKRNDTPSLGSSRLVKRQTNTKRRKRKRKSDSLIFVDGSSSEGGTSDESGCQSLFEDGPTNRSKSGSRNTSPDSSMYYTNVDSCATKPAMRLNSHHTLPSVDLTGWENKSTPIEPDGSSNPVQDIGRQIDDSNSDSDESDDELWRSPQWYRFGPTLAKNDNSNSLLSFARPCYAAQVEDASRERGFHNIIGKEYIDGEVHYMVDWIPTLVRHSVLREADAEHLISRFEARCQGQQVRRQR